MLRTWTCTGSTVTSSVLTNFKLQCVIQRPTRGRHLLITGWVIHHVRICLSICEILAAYNTKSFLFHVISPKIVFVTELRLWADRNSEEPPTSVVYNYSSLLIRLLPLATASAVDADIKKLAGLQSRQPTGHQSHGLWQDGNATFFTMTTHGDRPLWRYVNSTVKQHVVNIWYHQRQHKIRHDLWQFQYRQVTCTVYGHDIA